MSFAFLLLSGIALSASQRPAESSGPAFRYFGIGGLLLRQPAWFTRAAVNEPCRCGVCLALHDVSHCVDADAKALGDVRPQHGAARQVHNFPGIVASELARSQLPFGASINSAQMVRRCAQSDATMIVQD